MQTVQEKQTPQDKLRFALGKYEFLTARQLTDLLYKKGSLTYVRDNLKALGSITRFLRN